MVLGAGALFALKQAIYAARAENQDPNSLMQWFELPLPATPSRVQQLCEADLAKSIPSC
jgi:hypothetical protein